jgi:hypothetical protein
MNTEAIYSTKTNEDGMAAFVYANTRAGFNVVLRDMEANESVPFVTIYQTLDRAKAEADKLV